MAHSHNHNHNHHSPEDSDFTLMVAVTINSLLTVFQVIGGILSGSLSLIADALHNLSVVHTHSSGRDNLPKKEH